MLEVDDEEEEDVSVEKEAEEEGGERNLSKPNG